MTREKSMTRGLTLYALGCVVLIGLAGVAVLAGGWEVSRRLGRGPAAAVQAGTADTVTASSGA